MSSTASAYNIVATQVSAPSAGLERTDQTVAVDARPGNTFHMYRVRKTTGTPRGVLLLLPPGGSGFQNYEVGENGHYARSFAAFFAYAGIEVWGVSQRTQDLAPGSCDAAPASCAFLADFGLDALVDDAEFTRDTIRARWPHKKIVIGGLSLGGIAGLSAVNADPTAYSGLLVLEGASYTADPAIRAANTPFCQGLQAALSFGVTFDAGPGAAKMAAQLALMDPNGPSPIPGLPPGLTNKQALVLLFSTYTPSPISPRPGMINAVGDVASGTFTYANDSLFVNNVAQFMNYFSLALARDITCALDGSDTHFVSNLGAYHGEVYAQSAGLGLGSMVTETLSLMPNAHKRAVNYPSFGHVDAYFSNIHLLLQELPILTWLESRVW